MKPNGRFSARDCNYLSRHIALLGTFSEVTINCVLAPNNLSCLLAVAKRWANGLGYLLVQLVGNSR
jgi:hypothetical protein